MVEVSNGVHPMSEEDKLGLIGQARSAGFTVWSEVGKKDPDEDARIGIDDRCATIARELEAGADKVILEARESGTVGIYDRSGTPSRRDDPAHRRERRTRAAGVRGAAQGAAALDDPRARTAK